MNDDRRTRAAVHEVGHALMFLGRVPEQEFSIDLEGDAQAIARFKPQQTNDDLRATALTQAYVQQVLWVTVGGEVAEYVVYGNANALEQRLDYWTFARYAGLLFELLKHPEYVARPINAYEAELSANAVDVIHREYFLRTEKILTSIRSQLDQAVELVLTQGTLTRADLTRLMS